MPQLVLILTKSYEQLAFPDNPVLSPSTLARMLPNPFIQDLLEFYAAEDAVVRFKEWRSRLALLTPAVVKRMAEMNACGDT